jgi:hypothetical protein
MKNIENFKTFEKSFYDLTERDQKRFDVIIRNLRNNFYENEIKTFEKYLKEYKLSDDLKQFIEEEIEYLKKLIERRKKFKKEFNKSKK